ncbi:hypothetical protein SPRG_08151 [Saprolegnia parasitica CBS 223.65]|uniref:Uncharacterized protein n=1 Tax=Saprolegnia parasitica (strain CBS 223.65) TaxID=695850 RepID=A0A067CJ74_SAPPC|nr:hypothetical protein SPRG_08151 [Saprolegnia parasitica CBS 223.65]KDO26862.1 hypothetical protein SPRG_08151 [Saprolegnia parasitica CBS 223.65]|eukprot:XP_012202505.1 hypothetical protein SPRG_08151 [Saprolegnia parasitica CBS 223.65]
MSTDPNSSDDEEHRHTKLIALSASIRGGLNRGSSSQALLGDKDGDMKKHEGPFVHEDEGDDADNNLASTLAVFETNQPDNSTTLLGALSGSFGKRLSPPGRNELERWLGRFGPVWAEVSTATSIVMATATVLLLPLDLPVPRPKTEPCVERVDDGKIRLYWPVPDIEATDLLKERLGSAVRVGKSPAANPLPNRFPLRLFVSLPGKAQEFIDAGPLALVELPVSTQEPNTFTLELIHGQQLPQVITDAMVQ